MKASFSPGAVQPLGISTAHCTHDAKTAAGMPAGSVTRRCATSVGAATHSDGATPQQLEALLVNATAAAARDAGASLQGRGSVRSDAAANLRLAAHRQVLAAYTEGCCNEQEARLLQRVMDALDEGEEGESRQRAVASLHPFPDLSDVGIKSGCMPIFPPDSGQPRSVPAGVRDSLLTALNNAALRHSLIEARSASSKAVKARTGAVVAGKQDGLAAAFLDGALLGIAQAANSQRHAACAGHRVAKLLGCTPGLQAT